LPDQHRCEYSRQRVGCPQRIDETTAREPDFVPGADLGGDGGEPQRQCVDGDGAQFAVQMLGQPVAADQPGAP
jgi:hypothetical protein